MEGRGGGEVQGVADQKMFLNENKKGWMPLKSNMEILDIPSGI
jgi:hypothetical protein